jgi:hypothetical protein
MARTRQLILALLALAGLFPALAIAADTAVYPDQGAAYAACAAKLASSNAFFASSTANPKPQFTCKSGTGFYQCQRAEAGVNGACADGKSTPYIFSYPLASSCKARKPETSTFYPKSGSTSCSQGCVQYWYRNADGTSTGTYPKVDGATCSTSDFSTKCPDTAYWNGVLNVCEPKQEECDGGKKPNANGQCAEEPCPEGMTQQQDGTCKAKENDCPAGQVKGPDGSCVKKPDACGTGQAQGKDGTCKPDKDGDGNPDDEDSDDDGDDDKKSFSGGDSCAAPPSCSGDPVMCGQARIQWRIDCNTRRNVNIAGGACGSPPVYTGDKCDAMEYSQLLMQWRTACATEKLLTKGNTNPESGQPEWTKVGGMSQDPGAGANSSDTNVLTVKHVSTDDLDRSGFGGGACIGFGNAGSGAVSQAIGSTFAAPPPMWCDYMARLKAGLIIVASCVAVFILTRGGV